MRRHVINHVSSWWCCTFTSLLLWCCKLYFCPGICFILVNFVLHSSIAIILMGKRELVALLYLSSWCLVMVEWLFLAVPWGCLRFVIVVFPDHTHYFWRSMRDAPLWVNTIWQCPSLCFPGKKRSSYSINLLRFKEQQTQVIIIYTIYSIALYNIYIYDKQ